MNQSKIHLQPTDVLIVGAGITGLAHAAEAVARGLSVHIIDRDTRAVGASIRNFGHCCVGAQSGELLELATVAREGWLRHSELAGFFSVESGGLVVARSRAEVAVLEELAATRGSDQMQLINAAQVRQELSGSGDPAILAGALIRDDIRVDPREAVAKLAAWLAKQPKVTFSWRTSYFGTDSREPVSSATPDAETSHRTDVTVRTSRGTLTASRVIVCVGHDLDYVHPDVAEPFEVNRCSLQMALVRPAAPLTIKRAVLTGTSMLRYPAFAETGAAAELKKELAANSAELLAIDANLMLTQRPDGTLLIGDSHHTATTQDPFLIEQTQDTLLNATSKLLGMGSYTVLQRWQGIYASSPQQSFLIKDVAPNVTAVSVTSGIGMTISFGLAKKTFSQF
ncbi:TIGR03364 family FAD-dependent oxidoreductase [Arthrobacter glacialis]|uniref:TIGR03364 family FAD-dependent oxidoreductase n=1 Tax=Arthrobacter glacialis TaxID=1664 RepID=UPI000CD480EC|nr:TIGR03364 family FAD-dependent oxidoreductase [Arthrobacter glacialis]POH59434.1 TIGR03364 family FAD-dependent oxidoreductase [Arthrobacter glacialis]